jgi:hypothetical protein
MILRLLIGAVVFFIAYDKGGYGLVSRHSVGVVVWWAIVAGTLFGVVPVRRLPQRALVGAAFFAGFAAFNAASIAWAASAENAFVEFDRAALYLGVFLLAILCARDSRAAPISDGLALGIVAVGVVALGSRLFPHLFPATEVQRLLPGTRNRLSEPVGYWNGLGVLLALGVPLLLRAAVAARDPVRRGLAMAPFPALGGAIFLTSSRGATLAALVGAAAFVHLARARLRATGALLFAALGSGLACAILTARPRLVDGTSSGSDARTALLIAVLSLLLGACYGVIGGWRPRVPRVRRRSVALPTAAVALALIVGGIAIAHPLRRFDSFKQPPKPVVGHEPGFVTAHLLSGAGNGRWQFWTAALHEWESRPIVGRGAGSYEAWWAQHASFSYFVRDAHSLYLETLGELGVVGFVLLLATFASALATLRRSQTRDEPAGTSAALGAAFLAYAVAAGIDWMWELTVVSVVAMACLGLVAGSGSRSHKRAGATWGRRTAVLVVGCAVIACEAVPLLGQLELDASRAAVQRGDGAAAVKHAASARQLEPWAASPYTQLALVYEAAGDLGRARAKIRQALRRDAYDWHLWLIAARIETKSGALASARLSLHRAASLNPRSPLFGSLANRGH